jgi:flagellar protein FlgJ
MPINEIREQPETWNSSNVQVSGRIDEKRLEKACQEFESIFIHQMMKTMRQTVPQTGFMGEGTERNIFQALFDEEMSKTIGKSGRLGLGKVIYNQMMRRFKTQE